MADEHLLQEELERLLLDGGAVTVDEEIPGLAQYDLRVRRELLAVLATTVARGVPQGDPPVDLEAGGAVEEPVERQLAGAVLVGGARPAGGAGLGLGAPEQLVQRVLQLLHLLDGEVQHVGLRRARRASTSIPRRRRWVVAQCPDRQEALWRPVAVGDLVLARVVLAAAF